MLCENISGHRISLTPMMIMTLSNEKASDVVIYSHDIPQFSTIARLYPPPHLYLPRAVVTNHQQSSDNKSTPYRKVSVYRTEHPFAFGIDKKSSLAHSLLHETSSEGCYLSFFHITEQSY
ncbi:hypothetical protein DMENIID0001_033230 [Sergentomyia squamirostris]